MLAQSCVTILRVHGAVLLALDSTKAILTSAEAAVS